MYSYKLPNEYYVKVTGANLDVCAVREKNKFYSCELTRSIQIVRFLTEWPT